MCFLAEVKFRMRRLQETVFRIWLKWDTDCQRLNLLKKCISSEECAKEAEMLHNDEGNFGIKPYRIVNLISGSYRLPEIDDDSFYR